MNEQELKLERVKKSCKITATVSQVLEIILIVATVFCVIGGAVCIGMNKEINASIAQLGDQYNVADISEGAKIFDSASIGGFLKLTVHFEQLLQDKQYGTICGIYCLFGAVICGLAALVFEMIRRIFKTIRVSETPFTKEVLKGVRLMSITICVELLLMSGLGNAVIAALIFWSIYNILDYGFTIQQQVDETL